jgi:hypothetical protein
MRLKHLDLARHFHCTSATVCRWVKSGCPRYGKKKPFSYDVEEVRAWLVTQKQFHLISSDANQVKPEAAAALALGESEELKKLAAQIDIEEGLPQALSRLRTMEVSAFRAYQAAVTMGNPMLQQIKLKLHSDIVGYLIRAEQQVNVEHLFEEKAWSEVLDRLSQGVESVKMLINAMPRALSLRVNPTDPQHAEQVLRNWVDTQLYPTLGKLAER